MSTNTNHKPNMAQLHTPLTFTVRRHAPELIVPAKPTPRELKPLSDIDDQEFLRFQTRFIHFYHGDPKMRIKNPTNVIRMALAKVLVFYYPFAGRLKEGPGRKLMVDCTREGVLFIEAEADVTLKQFGDTLQPPFPCMEELLYDVPGSSGVLGSPLILIQGNKMQGYVKEKLMKDFDAPLQEDMVVIIKGCGVGAQEDKFPVLAMTKKIIFYKSTEVQLAVGWTGHPYGFQFQKLEEISDKMMGKTLTFDVIGNISWCGNMDCFKSTTGKDTKRLHLDLQNLEGTVMRCTFWGDFAVQVATHIDKHGSSMEQIIMIVQHGKVKKWADTITVQNDMFGTRLFLDNDLKDINDFRRSLILKQGGHGNSQSMITTQTNYPVRNEFIVNADRKTIEDVREIKLTPGINQDPNLPLQTECVVLCTIKLLEEDAGWFYPGCRTCKKKVKPKAEYLRDSPKPHPDVATAPADSLWCPKCNCLATSVIPKFRIQFRVQDPTGCVSLLMFDQEVTRLTGLSATDIRERQLKSVDHNSYPHELDVIINRQLAFKIVVTDYNVRQKYYTYTVNRVCDDPDIIDEMRGEFSAAQCTPEPADAEASCVKLSQSSQGGVDSKDVASVTGGGLAVEGEKDEATSPVIRRPTKKKIDSVLGKTGTSTAKRAKLKMETPTLIKKLEPYEE